MARTGTPIRVLERLGADPRGFSVAKIFASEVGLETA